MGSRGRQDDVMGDGGGEDEGTHLIESALRFRPFPLRHLRLRIHFYLPDTQFQRMANLLVLFHGSGYEEEGRRKDILVPHTFLSMAAATSAATKAAPTAITPIHRVPKDQKCIGSQAVCTMLTVGNAGSRQAFVGSVELRAK